MSEDPVVTALTGIALGLLLLIFGRRLFWLFVAIAGFLMGMELASMWWFTLPRWLSLLAGLAVGAIGALLAVVAQRLAFALAGFAAGIYVALMLIRTTGLAIDPGLPMLAGGLIGSVAALLLTDWAIVVLSSLVGAGAIVTSISVSPTVDLVLFVVLSGFGISVQRSTTAPK